MENYAELGKDRLLNIKCRVNQPSIPRVLRFLNADGSPHAITDYAFRLPVKKIPLANINLFELTIGDGLTVQGDDDNELLIEVTEEQATQRPNVYFWLLEGLADGEYQAWLNGDWEFYIGKFNGVEQVDEITINTAEAVVTITIEGGSSSGGGHTIQNNGVDLPTETNLNFKNGVKATDNPAVSSDIEIDDSYFGDIIHSDIADFDAAGVAASAQSAAQAYADSLVVGLWDDRGNWNPATNSNQYPTSGGSGTAGARLKGDIYTIAGLGSGVTALMGTKTVQDGDTVRSLVDNPGQTETNWAIAENNIGYVPENQANKENTTLDTSTTKYPTNRLTKEYADAKELKSASATGSVVDFTNPKIFNTIASPSASNITDDLTGARIGVVQKIYHNHSVAPTFPAGWVLIGGGIYTTNVLNIIYAEWVSGTRVEYWIVVGL